jgi:hypothetical protein
MFLLYFVFDWVVIFPLKLLYLRGLHNGSSESDVCHHVTGVTSHFWNLHITDCRDLLHGRVHNFSVAVLAGFYLVILLYVLARLAFWVAGHVHPRYLVWVCQSCPAKIRHLYPLRTEPPVPAVPVGLSNPGPVQFKPNKTWENG